MTVGVPAQPVILALAPSAPAVVGPPAQRTLTAPAPAAPITTGVLVQPSDLLGAGVGTSSFSHAVAFDPQGSLSGPFGHSAGITPSSSLSAPYSHAAAFLPLLNPTGAPLDSWLLPLPDPTGAVFDHDADGIPGLTTGPIFDHDADLVGASSGPIFDHDAEETLPVVPPSTVTGSVFDHDAESVPPLIIPLDPNVAVPPQEKIPFADPPECVGTGSGLSPGTCGREDGLEAQITRGTT